MHVPLAGSGCYLPLGPGTIYYPSLMGVDSVMKGPASMRGWVAEITPSDWGSSFSAVMV